MLASGGAPQGFARAGRVAAGARHQRDVHAAGVRSRAAGRHRERGVSGTAGVGRRGLEVAERLRPGAGARNDGAPRSESAACAAHGAQAPRRRAGRDRSLSRERAAVVAASGFRKPETAGRLAGHAAGRRGERAGDGRGRRRSEGAAGVREPLRDGDAQPEPDAAAAARRERPDRAAPVGRRRDGAVDGDRARRGGAGGGGRGVPVHAAIAAAAVGAARPRAAAGQGQLHAADGRHLGRRDRRSRARVRRDGRRDPGARAAPDPVGAPGHRRANGGAHRARGAQPACRRSG